MIGLISAHTFRLSLEVKPIWKDKKQKNLFLCLHFGVQIFQLLRSFLVAKLNKTSFQVASNFQSGQKQFHRMAAPGDWSGLRETQIRIIFKTRILRLKIGFHLQQIFPWTVGKSISIFRQRNFSKQNSVRDRRRAWVECRGQFIAPTLIPNKRIPANSVSPSQSPDRCQVLPWWLSPVPTVTLANSGDFPLSWRLISMKRWQMTLHCPRLSHGIGTIKLL